MKFYPDKKPYISPSALATWHRARSSFVRNYFMGERYSETRAIKAGKTIHALIEGGLLQVHHAYGANEIPIETPLPSGMMVMGIPDSRTPDMGELRADGFVEFVDYKSGKENLWDDVELAGDLKMKATAWLIYERFKGLGKTPKGVEGFIEYVPTRWSEQEKDIVPVEGESTVAARVTYASEELEAFTDFIEKTILDVNEAYEQWLTSTDVFVNQDDVLEYAKLNEQKEAIQLRMEQLKERIGDQMKMGAKENVSTLFGSFFWKVTKKYEYPPNMKINYLDMGLMHEDAVAIKKAMEVAEKKYQTDHDPVEVTKTVSFRPKNGAKKKSE